MPDFSVTTLDLLRHGACEGGEIFRGSTDVPLSDAGWQQMQASISSLEGWTRIISSDLQRCRQFAEAVSAQKQLPLTLDECLREIHFGDWEGRLISDVKQQDAEAWRDYFANPAIACSPNGEPMPDFHSRIGRALTDHLAVNRGEHLLLVTHGAVIRSMMVELLQMPLSAITRLSVPYACITRLKIFHMHGKPDLPQLCFHASSH